MFYALFLPDFYLFPFVLDLFSMLHASTFAKVSLPKLEAGG